jgi:hypothetical protein
MTSIEIRKQALEREEYRGHQLAEAVAGLPKNKSGRYKSGEANMLVSLAGQAHKTLCYYDVAAEPPAVAGITETWFDTAVERLAEIALDSAKRNPTGNASTNTKSDNEDTD